jgi:hypothetical protein
MIKPCRCPVCPVLSCWTQPDPAMSVLSCPGGLYPGQTGQAPDADRRRTEHRPTDPPALSREVRRLADAGLTVRDISSHLAIGERAVAELMRLDGAARGSKVPWEQLQGAGSSDGNPTAEPQEPQFTHSQHRTTICPVKRP